MNQRKRLTFEIALAGISTALSLICTVLYYFVPLAKLSFLALSGVALMLPLSVRSQRGCLLAYLATGGLSIAIMGPIAALPYLFLFGWQPVVMGYCQRYLPAKPYFSLPIKAALFNAGLYGTSVLFGLGDTITNALNRFGWHPAYWVLAIIGTVLWLFYDYAMQWLGRWLDRRLAKVTAKYLPPAKREEPTAEAAPTMGDLFGEYDAPHADDAPVNPAPKAASSDDASHHTEQGGADSEDKS